MKLNHTFLALMAAGLCSLPPAAFAQTAKDFEEMRNELKALRAELNALKAQQAQAPAAPAASASAWDDRIEAVELRRGPPVPAESKLLPDRSGVERRGFRGAFRVGPVKAEPLGVRDAGDGPGAPTGLAGEVIAGLAGTDGVDDGGAFVVAELRGHTPWSTATGFTAGRMYPSHRSQCRPTTSGASQSHHQRSTTVSVHHDAQIDTGCRPSAHAWWSA